MEPMIHTVVLTNAHGPDAWVLRCPVCLGAVLYGLRTRWTRDLLDTLVTLEAYTPYLEAGPIDRLWEIDYCSCGEPES